jgi:hypothetical protein
MRDPHVEALIYVIMPGPGVSYEDPKPVAFSNSLGHFDAADGELRFRPADHFSRSDEARTVIEPFLRAWEIQSDLSGNARRILFDYLRADVVDRNPPAADAPGAPRILCAEGASYGLSFGEFHGHLLLRHYPEPPTAFRTTPEVEMAYVRWNQFREGREPLQSMAYSVLTLMQSMAGDRARAAERFCVSRRVLDNVARLSSTKGDAATARKIDASKGFSQLTEREGAWLKEVIPRLVLRLGEHAAGGSVALLDMSGFSSL